MQGWAVNDDDDVVVFVLLSLFRQKCAEEKNNEEKGIALALSLLLCWKKPKALLRKGGRYSRFTKKK